ncbi:valine--tRNA ligase [bacterium]|nr:valine--tRNA ligase [bacterium]
MEKQYNPKLVEERIYRFWERKKFFSPGVSSSKKKYSIVIPPPNITGSLHMGHALNAVIQDILIRQKRMQGFKTVWVPGIDHAGIATQNVVEKQLKKEGKTRFDLGRKKFIERVWEWKKKSGNTILEQFKKIGVSCDWSRTRFTMDKEYSKAVVLAFSHYFKKGWIYRDKRVVNWCPRCKTSLSDLEVEYKEEKGKLWYIRYRFAEDTRKFIIVATTRPETLLGDAAVAVNPRDKRYKNLIGEKVILPVVEREIPIIGDHLVDPSFGTGAVKVTPAHDFLDYQIAKKHNLELIQIIDEDGFLNKDVPKSYQELNPREAREKIVQELRESGLLEKEEDYIHQVPVCYRCGSLIEPLPSEQWFLRMTDLAKIALEAIKNKKVKFYPQRWARISSDWLKKVRDWCISRQIWWGHQLPVWQCKNKNKFFFSDKKPSRCPICKKCKPSRVEDVFDTWFSSALWPFVAFGWPKRTKDFKEFYPTDVLSTARDIIFLWVIRMIFSGLEFTKKIPFRKVIIHATVLTKEGKRMSKSLGTGIDPLLLIEKYGADATRFGICWQISGLQDIRFDETKLLAGKKFCNKVWNASRFVLMNLEKKEFSLNKPKGRTAADKKILKELERVIAKVDRNISKFEFGKALQEIYRFFWNKFCDIYIEKAKKQIKNAKTKKEVKDTQRILIYVLVNSLKLLHPFIPFITEEIYQKLPLKNKKALIIEKWPKQK